MGLVSFWHNRRSWYLVRRKDKCLSLVPVQQGRLWNVSGHCGAGRTLFRKREGLPVRFPSKRLTLALHSFYFGNRGSYGHRVPRTHTSQCCAEGTSSIGNPAREIWRQGKANCPALPRECRRMSQPGKTAAASTQNPRSPHPARSERLHRTTATELQFPGRPAARGQQGRQHLLAGDVPGGRSSDTAGALLWSRSRACHASILSGPQAGWSR